MNLDELNQNDLMSACLLNIYIIKLLSKYGIESFENFRLENTINGKTVGLINFLSKIYL